MQTTVIHPPLGEIIYEENFRTGKKRISIGGVLLQKQSRKTYAYVTAEGTALFELKGSALSGAKLIYGGEVIRLTPPPTWYEILCTALFVIPLILGNVGIFPIIGGAIGGGVYGLMAFVTLVTMKDLSKVWQKLLVFAALYLATFALGFALALIFVAILF